MNTRNHAEHVLDLLLMADAHEILLSDMEITDLRDEAGNLADNLAGEARQGSTSAGALANELWQVAGVI